MNTLVNAVQKIQSGRLSRTFQNQLISHLGYQTKSEKQLVSNVYTWMDSNCFIHSPENAPQCRQHSPMQ